MDDVALRVGVAATYLWLGMVLAISFMEAPLKFRAPGLELRVGLAIGRLVFRALNVAEVGWAAVILLCLAIAQPSVVITALAAACAALLLVQLAGVRPRLNRRSDQVLRAADTDPPVPRSRAHHAYIALEVLKVASLVALGCCLLAV